MTTIIDLVETFTPAVTPSGARQSSALVGQSGLPRCARNEDKGERAIAANFAADAPYRWGAAL